MTEARPHDVRRLSIRVALTATGLVAVAYFLVALAVAAIVTRNLTAQVDAHLADTLGHVPHEPYPGSRQFEPPPGDRPGVLPFLTWTIKPDGSVNTAASNPALPAAYQHVSAPQTATVGGTELRIAGAPAGDDYVVVGQNLDSVSQAQSTLIVAEVLIAPILLAVIFLGAVAIGRRVATPVERARRRQLEFTADASHELRTPLSVIEANTSLALAEDRSEDWYKTAFERVDLESKRMRRLLDDLLWLARFDATQGPPNTEPVDLGVLAAQTVDRFAAIAETRRLSLQLATPAEGVVIAAPPEWLDRLVGVLLDNACKYSPDGGIVVVAVTADSGRIQITVDDAGPGIPDGERARIFDRFHRATESQAGAGLGLAIADAIVRATNGRWKIGDSRAGGASMSVSWPRAFLGGRETAARSVSRTQPTD